MEAARPTAGRAARGRVGEYGHLAARDATEGAGVAKKRHFGPSYRRNISAQIGFGGRETAPGQCRDGSVTSLVRAKGRA
jgi:hypothetical protein